MEGIVILVKFKYPHIPSTVDGALRRPQLGYSVTQLLHPPPQHFLVLRIRVSFLHQTLLKFSLKVVYVAVNGSTIIEFYRAFLILFIFYVKRFLLLATTSCHHLYFGLIFPLKKHAFILVFFNSRGSAFAPFAAALSDSPYFPARLLIEWNYTLIKFKTNLLFFFVFFASFRSR